MENEDGQLSELQEYKDGYADGIDGPRQHNRSEDYERGWRHGRAGYPQAFTRDKPCGLCGRTMSEIGCRSCDEALWGVP